MPTYTEDDVQHALTAVRVDGQSIRKAATDWGVPRVTLAGRLQGSRPKGEYEAAILQKLNPEQEHHLANWALTQDALGVPVTHTQLKDMANRVLRASGSTDAVGRHWLERFLARHPALKTKKERSLEDEGAEGASSAETGSLGS